MLKNFIAFTPVTGVLIFSLTIPFVISRFGVSFGVLSALVLSLIWFICMLRTSEMPH
tara:strand:+ start:466 stop:636 length:171 start_codon:yes stop_codon:yes gene_type:complete